MTAPRIDPMRRAIEDGSRRLPFRLDLRDDSASLAAGGRDYRVRPLRWGAKVRLARFASFGPELVAEEVLRLCCDDEVEEGDREPVLALVRWISEPPDAAPVPLESRSVAAVTLQLCRAMHLRPMDFDAMAATDVEAMWLALTLSSTSEEPEAAAAQHSTKIMIMPDPGQSEDRTSAAAALSASSARASFDHHAEVSQPDLEATAAPLDTPSVRVGPGGGGGGSPAVGETAQRELVAASLTTADRAAVGLPAEPDRGGGTTTTKATCGGERSLPIHRPGSAELPVGNAEPDLGGVTTTKATRGGERSLPMRRPGSAELPVGNAEPDLGGRLTRGGESSLPMRLRVSAD
jgi:hypothetical protein